MKPTRLDRFEEKYIPEPNSGCWIWFGATVSAKGYGYFGNGVKNELAHRFSYRAHVGEIPAGLNILHRCDNPTCVNPDHLFIGTTRDNWLDCIGKGRASHQTKLSNFARGERSPSSRLTEADVRHIRAVAKQHTLAALGRKYGVRYTTIRSVIRGETWKHVV